MAVNTWEDAVGEFSSATFATRDDVAGSGDGHDSWFADTQGYLGVSPSTPLPDADYLWSKTYFRKSDGQELMVLMALTLARNVGSNDAGTPLGRFVHEPWDLIGPVATGPEGNDAAKYGSFDAAAQGLRDTVTFLDTWRGQIQDWAGEIDVDDSELQGTAAGEFKDVLLGLSNQFHDLVLSLTRPDFAPPLEHAGQEMRQAAYDLLAAHDAWRATDEAWPAHHVYNMFWGAVDALDAQLTALQQADSWGFVDDGAVGALQVPNYGSPADQAFWDRMQDDAKKSWIATLTPLDTAAVAAGSKLDTAFRDARNAVPEQVDQPLFNPPKPVSAAPPGGGDHDPDSAQTPPLPGGDATGDADGPGGGVSAPGGGTDPGGDMDPGGDTDPGGAGLDQHAPPSETETVGGPDGAPSGADLPGGEALGGDGPGADAMGGGGGPGGEGSGAPGGDGTGLDPDAAAANAYHNALTGNVHAPPSQETRKGDGGTGGLGATDGDAHLVDGDGNTLTNPDGTPFTVPPGARINGDRTITDSKGNLLRNPDGSPKKAPAGAKIANPGPDGSGTGTGTAQQRYRQQLDALGKQQQQAEKQAQQRQAEIQEQQHRAEQHRQKLQQQQEAAQEKEYQAALRRARDNARTSSDHLNRLQATGTGGRRAGLREAPPSVTERSTRSGFGPEGRLGGGGRGGGTAGEGELPPGARRIRTSSTEPNLAAETAARESAMMNRTSSNGSPMVPPMGGGAGAGGQGGRDRERRTFLDEDEETWGTQQQGSPGVIG